MIFLLPALIFTFMAGETLYYVKNPSYEPPVLKETLLQAIAECESSDRHVDKSGKVLRGELTPDDIGRYQVNEYYWGRTARDMDLDLTDEKDNKTFATYLLDNYGLKPWSASKKCLDRLL